MMSEDKLREIIRSELEDRSNIDINTHAEQHEFIATLIDEERRKQERWDAIQRQVLGWGIIAIVGSIGSLIAQKFGFDL